jgi:hypothetical protein
VAVLELDISRSRRPHRCGVRVHRVHLVVSRGDALSHRSETASPHRHIKRACIQRGHPSQIFTKSAASSGQGRTCPRLLRGSSSTTCSRRDSASSCWNGDVAVQ